MVVAAGGSSAADGKQVMFARFAGAGTAGIAELLLFHPVDTVAKRLMNSTEVFSTSIAQRLIFQDKADASFFAKWKSLFPGIGFGALYKVSQRVYKFGGQPYVKEFFKTSCQLPTDTTWKRVFVDGLAGSCMGAGEVVLLPLDVLKIKAQTNPEFREMGVTKAMRTMGVSNLYAGWNWTIMRNVPGSFALFGGNAFAKEMMGLEDPRDATFLQTSLSSLAGSIASILTACPLDVVKTRMQSGVGATTESGTSIIKSILKDEGAGAFFKGVVPKVLTVGPKLVFSFTIAQYLTSIWEKRRQ